MLGSPPPQKKMKTPNNNELQMSMPLYIYLVIHFINNEVTRRLHVYDNSYQSCFT